MNGARLSPFAQRDYGRPRVQVAPAFRRADLGPRLELAEDAHPQRDAWVRVGAFVVGLLLLAASVAFVLSRC